MKKIFVNLHAHITKLDITSEASSLQQQQQQQQRDRVACNDQHVCMHLKNCQLYEFFLPNL